MLWVRVRVRVTQWYTKPSATSTDHYQMLTTMAWSFICSSCFELMHIKYFSMWEFKNYTIFVVNGEKFERLLDCDRIKLRRIWTAIFCLNKRQNANYQHSVQSVIILLVLQLWKVQNKSSPICHSQIIMTTHIFEFSLKLQYDLHTLLFLNILKDDKAMRRFCSV